MLADLVKTTVHYNITMFLSKECAFFATRGEATFIADTPQKAAASDYKAVVLDIDGVTVTTPDNPHLFVQRFVIKASGGTFKVYAAMTNPQGEVLLGNLPEVRGSDEILAAFETFLKGFKEG